jgi:hypothetical protein
MNRRTVLQRLASTAAALPFVRLRLAAQARELTPEATATLREVAQTVLPASLGPVRVEAVVTKFIEWTYGYREGAALAHGYGHPRLRFAPPSPVPRYVEQLDALAGAAQSRGGRFAALDFETRRHLLDEALTAAGVDRLPQRPSGQHVVADLMASYFRSSEAADDCYRAAIGRQKCRPIAVTTKRPEPLRR